MPPVLETKGLIKQFGGITATNDVSLSVEKGARHALIGPNGAGKTTIINLLTGVLRPTAGTIALEGQDITNLEAHKRVQLGIARTFQINQLFGDLTPLETIGLAVSERMELGRQWWRTVGSKGIVIEESVDILQRFHLADVMDERTINLPYGKQRLLEIAVTLGLKPKVLLLDEPAAGLSKGDKQRLTTLLRRIADLGIAVIIVEHDMPMIMALSDRIVVLDGGKRIAIGDPATVRNDPLVRKAYLGDAAADKAPRPARQATEKAALEIKSLNAFYGLSQALDGINVVVADGEAVAVLGANGAGKTTLMRSIAGLEPPRAIGEIQLQGRRIDNLPAHARARIGIVLVPEGRQVFPELTVRQNLQLGAYARAGINLEDEVETMLKRFPRLRQRIDHRAGLLSGGEQQMLAVARGLLTSPKVLMLDEPSLGLAPLVVDELFASFEQLRIEGMTLIVVDQMAGQALALADRAYLLETGAIVKSGTAEIIAADPSLEAAYLGGDHASGEQPVITAAS
jgi:ABC-type branched-subunit amino acid transport system ATPase component